MKLKHLLSAGVFAAAAVAGGAELSREFIQIAPRCAVPPVIDGKLDDAAWRNAPVFRPAMRDPKEKTSSAMETRLLWDDRGIYVGVLNEEAEPGKLKTLVRTRDGGKVWADDSNEFFFFPTRNPIHYYKFDINSLGVFSDWYRRDFNMQYPDWNASEVKCASGRTPQGWTIEFFLSWRDLNYKPETGGFIGVLQNRFVWKNNAWLTKNSNTGGGFFNPKFAWVLLSGPGGSTPAEAAGKLAPVMSKAWFVADDPDAWILVSDGKIETLPGAGLVARQRKKAVAALAAPGLARADRSALEKLRARFAGAEKLGASPAAVAAFQGVADDAAKLAESTGIQDLFN